MTISVSSLLTKAGILLLDVAQDRTSAAELLGWINSGAKEILLFKPTARIVNEAVQLAAGSKQSLPSGATQLLDVTRNMGTDGASPGRPVRMVSREVADAMGDWYTATASATVRHVIYNSGDPKTFYVYPPQPTSNRGYVEMQYACAPAEVTSTTGELDLDAIYEPVLLDYILFRANSKDSEAQANQQLAVGYFAMFQQKLMGKAAAEANLGPQAALGPMAPAAPGSDR